MEQNNDTEIVLDPQTEALKNTALAEAANEASERIDPRLNPDEFVREMGRLFIQKKLDYFPELCEIARVQNILKMQDLQKNGKKGRFTDSYGWSEKGDFKFKYEVPRELYLFMTNLVYRDFWTKDNERIADKFMHMVVTGECPDTILIWVKSIYGSNSQKIAVV